MGQTDLGNQTKCEQTGGAVATSAVLYLHWFAQVALVRLQIQFISEVFDCRRFAAAALGAITIPLPPLRITPLTLVMDCCSLRKMTLSSVMISSILLLPLVNGGCSFSQEGKDTSGVFKDMDAARLAAKMALAHQGLDIEAQKAESKRGHEAEPYVPQFYTADESEEVEGYDKETNEE